MDGVSDAVLSSNSIACVSEASLIDKSSTDIDDLLHKIKADANPEQIDLHYLIIRFYSYLNRSYDSNSRKLT